MYNFDVKNKYLETVNGQELSIVYNMFVRSEVYETAIDKDMYAMTTQERLEVLKIMQYSSLNTIINANSRINKYCRWCMDQGYCTRREMPIIPESDFEKCLKSKGDMVTYKELTNIMSSLENSCDRVMIEAAFLGIKGNDYDELFYMKFDDIEPFNNCVKLCTGRKIYVTDSFIANAEISDMTNLYYMRNGRTIPMYGEYVIKHSSIADASARTSKKACIINSRLKYFRDYSGIYLSTSSLFDSGVVHFVKERYPEISSSNENMKHDLKMALLSPMISNQYGFKPNTVWRAVQKYKRYFE